MYIYLHVYTYVDIQVYVCITLQRAWYVYTNAEIRV